MRSKVVDNDIAPAIQQQSQSALQHTNTNSALHRGHTVQRKSSKEKKTQENTKGGIIDKSNIIADFKKRIQVQIDQGKKLIEGGLPAGVDVAQFQGVLGEYETTLKEIAKLESSSYTYNVIYAAESGGVTAYNPKTGFIDVIVEQGSSNAQSNGLIAHELKHAYQFETGKISFTKDGYAGSLTDITDEVEAYNRQSYLEYGVGHKTWTADDVIKFGKSKGIDDYGKMNQKKTSLRGKAKKNLIKKTQEAAQQGNKAPEIFKGYEKYYKK